MRNLIIKNAKAEIGYNEYPAGTNKTKFGKWFGFDGVAWCAMFVSWVYDKSGAPLGNIGFTKGMAGCQTAVDYFRKKNMITTNPQPGDIAFFDWNGDKRYDHVGIFVRDMDGKKFTTIEGNTSLKNDSNGGSVMERMRDYKFAIFVKVI